MGFGAFVEILPGKEGLVRIGELADYHVPTVEDVVQVGDEIMVVVIEIDRQGRVNLSRKAAMHQHLAKARRLPEDRRSPPSAVRPRRIAAGAAPGQPRGRFFMPWPAQRLGRRVLRDRRSRRSAR